jgi:hypothetical protein
MGRSTATPLSTPYSQLADYTKTITHNPLERFAGYGNNYNKNSILNEKVTIPETVGVWVFQSSFSPFYHHLHYL